MPKSLRTIVSFSTWARPLVTEDGPFPAAGDHEIWDNALRALRAPERERIAFRRHDDSGIGGALNGDRFAVEGHFIGGAEGIDARPDEVVSPFLARSTARLMVRKA